jgi:methionine synthase I (cobalamin-dependent)
VWLVSELVEMVEMVEMVEEWYVCGEVGGADTTTVVSPADNAGVTLAQLDTRLRVQQKAIQKSAVALEKTSAQENDEDDASLNPTLVIGAFGAFMLLALLF